MPCDIPGLPSAAQQDIWQWVGRLAHWELIFQRLAQILPASGYIKNRNFHSHLPFTSVKPFLNTMDIKRMTRKLILMLAMQG